MDVTDEIINTTKAVIALNDADTFTLAGLEAAVVAKLTSSNVPLPDADTLSSTIRQTLLDYLFDLTIAKKYDPHAYRLFIMAAPHRLPSMVAGESDIMQKIGEVWKSLSEEDKNVYYDLARMQKDYAVRNPEIEAEARRRKAEKDAGKAARKLAAEERKSLGAIKGRTKGKGDDLDASAADLNATEEASLVEENAPMADTTAVDFSTNYSTAADESFLLAPLSEQDTSYFADISGIAPRPRRRQALPRYADAEEESADEDVNMSAASAKKKGRKRGATSPPHPLVDDEEPSSSLGLDDSMNGGADGSKRGAAAGAHGKRSRIFTMNAVDFYNQVGSGLIMPDEPEAPPAAASGPGPAGHAPRPKFVGCPLFPFLDKEIIFKAPKVPQKKRRKQVTIEVPFVHIRLAAHMIMEMPVDPAAVEAGIVEGGSADRVKKLSLLVLAERDFTFAQLSAYMQVYANATLFYGSECLFHPEEWGLDPSTEYAAELKPHIYDMNGVAYQADAVIEEHLHDMDQLVFLAKLHPKPDSGSEDASDAADDA
jgi:hypothetical protein